MPITYRYLPQNRAILASVTGELKLEDLLGYLGRIADDPAISSEHMTLFDARALAVNGVGPTEIAAVAERTKTRSDRMAARKLAIVTRGEKETELAELYEQLAASFHEDTIVFYDLGVACEWLGIPADLAFRTAAN